MTTKICTKCNQIKKLADFPKQAARKDGLSAHCKQCAVLATQTRQKTLTGLVKKIFHNQHMTTKKMGRPAPTYTEQELFDWMIVHGYHSMWNSWVTSGYDKWLSPSIDRKDNTQSYTLHNIQLLTWRENLENQKKDNITGRYLHTGSKAVDQLDLEGNFIQSFPSAAIAMRTITGHRGTVSNITYVCSGKLKTAYGFKWRFALS